MPFRARSAIGLTEATRDLIEGRKRDLVLEPEPKPVTPARDIIEIAAEMFDYQAVDVYKNGKLVFVGHRGEPAEKWKQALENLDDAPSMIPALHVECAGEATQNPK